MRIAEGALLGVLLWQASGSAPPVATPGHMRYQRAIRVDAGSGQACAVLDGAIFPHAAESLKDLRVFQITDGGGAATEVPYAITVSEAVTQETEPARVLNLGRGGGAEPKIEFDLQMPARAYTDVELQLGGHDFVATATVTGMQESGGKETALGVFTLFDLSAQRLSHDTTLPLAESTFPYLHVELAVVPSPGSVRLARFGPEMVEGARVPPSREAQTLYTTVASAVVPTTDARATPRKTRFDIALPLRVPVDRVSFDIPGAYTGNFSRDVTIHSSPDSAGGSDGTASMETVTGTISRVQSVAGARAIHEQELSVAATLGTNLQTAGRVWVEIENGDDPALPIRGVRLEMRQRRLCFDLAGNAQRSLYYGDAALIAPVYDYQRLFVPTAKPVWAELGPEEWNAAYLPPAEEQKPFTERHPEVLWIALIGVICALGVVALRSARSIHR